MTRIERLSELVENAIDLLHYTTHLADQDERDTGYAVALAEKQLLHLANYLRNGRIRDRYVTVVKNHDCSAVFKALTYFELEIAARLDPEPVSYTDC